MKSVKIQVCQMDIDLGTRGDPYKCPLALAMARAGLESPSVRPMSKLVGPASEIGWYSSMDTVPDCLAISWSSPAGRISRTAPAVAHRWVLSYDASEPVKPFEFELAVPQ